MQNEKVWRDENFDLMNWHDCSVHSFGIREANGGNGILVLDIDYITECFLKNDGSYKFSVAPAELLFYEASDLVVLIDYKKCSAGMTPFTIQKIDREIFSYQNGYETYRWTIDISWPTGSIEFVAKGFKMTLTSEPVESDDPTLPRATLFSP